MLNDYYTEKLLGLKDIILEKVEENENTRHIFLRMPQRIHICPRCGTHTSKVHDYRIQRVKDIPSFGLNTILHIRKRRHVCPYCNKKFYENIEFLPRYQHTTNRLWAYTLSLLSQPRSMSNIADHIGLSAVSVARILDVASHCLTNLPEVLAIDEFRGNSGGEKFQTILTNPKKHTVLDILPTRKQEDLCSYFSRFNNRNNVKYVVMDMSSNFRSMAKSCFPRATIIADKYHVVRQVTWAFENVRKQVQKSFGKGRRKYFKRSRRLLLMAPDKLTPSQLEEVSRMLSLSKELALAYHLKNEFYRFMKSKDRINAKKSLSNWYLLVGVSNIDAFNKCISTFSNWQEEILNAFDTGLTNGYTEGCNNKIKVIKRNAYGMRNFVRFRKRILISMT